jgi:hypothetical protein
VRKLVYVAVVMLLAGCVPIGVRVQNMLAHASHPPTAALPEPGARSPAALS